MSFKQVFDMNSDDFESKLFQDAVNDASELAALMGKKWRFRVWYNLGWAWEIMHGNTKISMHNGVYTLYQNNGVRQVVVDGPDPQALEVEAALQLRAMVSALNGEVSGLELNVT